MTRRCSGWSRAGSRRRQSRRSKSTSMRARRAGMSLRWWREVARVLVELARGLAAVHAAGVIHRDVKPENVIVGHDGRTRLGDFGLARADGVASGDIEASAVAGTPAYMAPEVLRGGRA